MDQTTRVHLYGYFGIVLALATASWANPVALVGAVPIVLVATYEVLRRGQSQKERIEHLEERLPAADGGEADA